MDIFVSRIMPNLCFPLFSSSSFDMNPKKRYNKLLGGYYIHRKYRSGIDSHGCDASQRLVIVFNFVME